METRILEMQVDRKSVHSFEPHKWVKGLPLLRGSAEFVEILDKMAKWNSSKKTYNDSNLGKGKKQPVRVSKTPLRLVKGTSRGNRIERGQGQPLFSSLRC